MQRAVASCGGVLRPRREEQSGRLADGLSIFLFPRPLLLPRALSYPPFHSLSSQPPHTPKQKARTRVHPEMPTGILRQPLWRPPRTHILHDAPLVVPSLWLAQTVAELSSETLFGGLADLGGPTRIRKLFFSGKIKFATGVGFLTQEP